MKLAAILIGVALGCAQELAVVEKKGHALGFYDSSGARLGGVELKTHPHELIFSADGKEAFVTENGMLWMTDPGQGGNSIAVVDLAGKKLAGRIELGQNYRPHGMDLDPRNGHMVVTVEGPSGLLLIDSVGRKVVRRFDTKGDAPHMVTLDPKGEVAWVSNSASGTLAAVTLKTGAVRLIEAGKNPQQCVVSADGSRLYLTVMESNQMLEIDTTSGKVLRRIYMSKGPARLAFLPGEKMLISNLIKGVAWVDLETGKEVYNIPLPGRPLSMTLSRDRKTAYLGIQDDDQIAVVDVEARKIVRYLKTPAGAGPDPVLELR